MADDKNRQQTTLAKLCLICRKQYGSESSVCPDDGGHLMPVEGPPRMAEPDAQAASRSKETAAAIAGGTYGSRLETNGAEKDAASRANKTSGIVLGIVLVAFGVLLSVTMAWPGPPEDSGPLYKKLLWQACIFLSDRASAAGQYPLSRSLLTIAENNCQNLMDGHYRLQQTLERQSQLYAGGGMFHDQEKVNTRLVAIFSERARIEADHFLDEIRSLAPGKSDLSPIFDRALILSRTLSAYGEYDKQETMLVTTITNLEKAAGKNYPRIADLKLDLAKCHQNRRRLQEVRPLLVDAVRIRTSQGKPDGDTVAALLKLAQFDRDYGKIQSAEQELAQALSIAERLPASNRALLVECLSEYADLMRMTNRAKEAAQYQLKISQLGPAPKGSTNK